MSEDLGILRGERLGGLPTIMDPLQLVTKQDSLLEFRYKKRLLFDVLSHVM